MFDAQVVLSPKNSPLGKVISQYVPVRIIRLDNVDLGLFDYDRNNPIFFFALNADEQIYLRYGGRICSPPALDRDFKTIDLLMLFDVERLDERARALFFDAG